MTFSCAYDTLVSHSSNMWNHGEQVSCYSHCELHRLSIVSVRWTFLAVIGVQGINGRRMGDNSGEGRGWD